MAERRLFDLTGNVVLAMGGNSGIGLAFLTRCARQTTDVSDEDAVINAFAKTINEFGRVDCVLADAGFQTRA